jgi:hypothetical protein
MLCLIIGTSLKLQIAGETTYSVEYVLQNKRFCLRGVKTGLYSGSD